MAQISEQLYKDIADSYALIQVALSGVSDNARNALDKIVDIDTLDYPSAGSGASADAALEVELALLQVFNAAYVGSQSIENSTSSLLNAVSSVNDFVISNSTTAGTASAKMLAWINTDMAGTWGSSCPIGWANFCRSAGYSVAGWVTTGGTLVS